MVTKEQIGAFLSGSDPMEHIIKIECGYTDEKVSIIYRAEDGKKRIKRDFFRPFVWATESCCKKMFGGDRTKLKSALSRYNIGCRGLRINRDDGTVPDRMRNGYRILFEAKGAMAYNEFMRFFKESGYPIYSDNENERNYIAVSPVEQYMISTGKRLFKGYDDYDDLLRMEWDLETEGLDPTKDAISQIGIRTNKGFERIITIEGCGKDKIINEINAIREFFNFIKEIKPDVITGHNTENFDWNFIDVRLKNVGSSLGDFSKQVLPMGVYKKKKQQVLKLGGEMEYYYPTVMWGHNLTDSLFAVRRAQAIDSNMKSATLKYVTKYAGIAKKNRVYVPGKIINDTWEDLDEHYAFNDDNGRWFKVDEGTLSKTKEDGSLRYVKDNDGITDTLNNERLTFVSGRYIVQRYLLDDLWETDKVELQYNQSNYLVSKMLPVSFEKVCTMGTAAIWKYIMLAWSYENNLGIPEITNKVPFTGGLSRLLSVGWVNNIVKLDYNSLYPSIYLTFNIKNAVDILDVLLVMLDYVLSMREHYKELKNVHGENVDKLKSLLKTVSDKLEIDNINKKIKEEKRLKTKNNTLQLPLKIFGNSYFGGASSGQPFPWTDTSCIGPEQTTCTGRQMLRLMISHFNSIGYKPIVGDSFTGDTPLFIKDNKTGLIDIKPISELINEEHINKDVLGREYDYSVKDYKILCRSGWVEPSYIYRHKTEKPIYHIEDNNMTVDVTEDHSLFDSERNKLKPSEIKTGTVLEYYTDNICSNVVQIPEEKLIKYVKLFNNNQMKDIPINLLNSDKKSKSYFLNNIKFECKNFSKTMTAKIIYMKKCIENA